MAEIRRTLTVVNPQGLHARPCHSIVSSALSFGGELRLAHGGREVNGKSILELMTLQAACGTELEVRAWGSGAEDLMERIEALFQNGFGEVEAS